MVAVVAVVVAACMGAVVVVALVVAVVVRLPMLPMVEQVEASMHVSCLADDGAFAFLFLLFLALHELLQSRSEATSATSGCTV